MSDTTVQAREDARRATGEFGIQAHTEAGIITGPAPSIDVDAATDWVVGGALPGVFADESARLSEQLWEVHTALISSSTHGLPNLNLETTVDDRDGHLYGVQVGYLDERDLVIARHHELDLFAELDGTSGRDRARIIVAGLVAGYDEVHDLVQPRA